MDFSILQVSLILVELHGCMGQFDFNNLFLENSLRLNDLEHAIPFEARPVPVPDVQIPNDDEYDFIIVGSGSAGSVIANRLSEVSNWKILLLEAGLPRDMLSEFPTLTSLLHFTDYNWGYISEPQSHACLAMVDQKCSWPRGKALGGTSVINRMIYARGNPQDYNRWAVLGNPGWSYAGVLPYFLKSELSRLNINFTYDAYHNRAGYMEVNDAYLTELGNAFVIAGQDMGYRITDYNSPLQLGFSRIQANTKQGRRQSVADAFLTTIAYRENLKILTGAMVTKILINPESKQASGVEYNWKDNNLTARATKEVIISAGVFNSPQLLMLSGIGPSSHLDEVGIPTMSDLPVGQTLYDHLLFGGLVITTNFTTNAPSLGALEVLQWYLTGKGPLSSIEGSQALAFLNTSATTDEIYPDIELIVRTGSIITDGGTVTRTTLRVSDDYYNRMYGSMDYGSTFTILPILLHPKSKGFMKLKSTNPYDFPLLYPNYLTDPGKQDVKTLTAAIRFIEKLCETTALKTYNAQIVKKSFAGCEHLDFDSDEHWECALRYMATSAHNPTSTCKMGPQDDPFAVVNHELKVYGISNLRVADGSVIPIPLSGHTHAPVMMIGEMTADLIKAEWSSSNLQKI